MSLFEHGDDAFKSAIHGATLVLALEMAVYNLGVYRVRRGGWHLTSAAVYGALALFEVTQIRRHRPNVVSSQRRKDGARREDPDPDPRR